MEEVDEFLSSERSRREVLAGAGSAVVAALAGCSGDENDTTENSGSNSTDGATDEPGSGEGSDPTGTEGGSSGTEDGNQSTGEGTGTDDQSLEKYDDNESQAEIEGEERLTNFYQGWIEFEELGDQLPRENYTLDEFPSLEILDAEVDAYSEENESVYLAWRPDNDDNLTLVVQAVESFEDSNGTQEDYSNLYMDGEADVEGILSEVVEGYNDVSPDLDEEYAEILGVN